MALETIVSENGGDMVVVGNFFLRDGSRGNQKDGDKKIGLKQNLFLTTDYRMRQTSEHPTSKIHRRSNIQGPFVAVGIWDLVLLWMLDLDVGCSFNS